MEDIETRALNTAPYPPEWWYCYTNDSHTKIEKVYVEEFTKHLHNIDKDIQFMFALPSHQHKEKERWQTESIDL